MAPPPTFVLDVSRLIWRLWGDRQPTGIDRVCLQYVEHLADRSLAMVQRGNVHLVLGQKASARLFGLLRDRDARLFRVRLVAILVTGVLARAGQGLAGRIYINVGHTGLEDARLWRWLHRLGLRPVVMVHDLIPITHPETCRPAEADKHRRRMVSVLNGTAGVIANSRATRDSLAAFARGCNRVLANAVVAPLGIEPMALQPADGHAPAPYFLVLGTIEARKGHSFLFRIWELLSEQLGPATPRLVVVGQRGWEAEDAFAWLDRPGRDHVLVEERSAVSDSELRGLLAGARALLMPSLVEGYGLPVAEALAAGTPVLASDLPVYREFAGDRPVYLPSLDEARWLRAIRGLVEDQAAYDELRKQVAGYSPPTWDAHFAIVEPWLERL